MQKITCTSCHIRFNPKNSRHIHAAHLLATVAPKFKTAFVTLAIEEYMQAHPTGIDLQALSEVQRCTWQSAQPMAPAMNPNAVLENSIGQVVHEDTSEIKQAIDSALSFFNIV